MHQHKRWKNVLTFLKSTCFTATCGLIQKPLSFNISCCEHVLCPSRAVNTVLYYCKGISAHCIVNTKLNVMELSCEKASILTRCGQTLWGFPMIWLSSSIITDRRETYFRGWCHSVLIQRPTCKGVMWLDSWDRGKKKAKLSGLWFNLCAPPETSCPEQLTLASPLYSPQ